MMELTSGFIPPDETWQVLCEAPGFISQSQLRTWWELCEQLRNEDPEIRAAFAALKTLMDFTKEDDLATPQTMEALSRHVVKAVESASNPERLSALRRLCVALKEAIEAHFKAGWLIEMGRFCMYRDHTGILVLTDDPLHAWDFN